MKWFNQDMKKWQLHNVLLTLTKLRGEAYTPKERINYQVLIERCQKQLLEHTRNK